MAQTMIRLVMRGPQGPAADITALTARMTATEQAVTALGTWTNNINLLFPTLMGTWWDGLPTAMPSETGKFWNNGGTLART